ncbi:NAD(P)/FAD-dependent oxidoreductase [Telmatospirillum sp.]|uniref:NAD(P)/FAD-dependent oxidoreductase n=1 Tax=Telmatospirillum sp. TaxID=2079197 RepID=UPI002846B9B9|nr:NAD(P)/FAD-dependent oxidoreductase [Telmatospirillum sp.]MDR3435387.1 NAD(P)/FAD-dependent oxidoreductase [Telmatospirillum sp.]
MKTVTAHDLAETYDLVVVGAGPAGLSAAATAADHGVTVLLVDENASIGGQFYRAITTTPVEAPGLLGPDFWKGRPLAQRIAAAPVSYLPKAAVWNIVAPTGPAAGFEIGVSGGGAARVILAHQCILATGALERPFPVPGWTLPGVMTAGAAQTLLKESGLVPSGRTVLVGTGPLVYALAEKLAAAGAPPLAVLDTTIGANWSAALPWLPEFLISRFAVKGLRLLAALRRCTRVISGVSEVALDGTGQGVERIRFRRHGGAEETLAVDYALLHQGVIPNIALSCVAGCSHDWDPLQLCWFPTTDATFQSSVGGLAIAGDGAGIGGAESALIAGEIAAIGAIGRLGFVAADICDGLIAGKRRQWSRSLRGRRFIDHLYQPGRQFRIPANPSTIVCRCEEVTAGQIRRAVVEGGIGPNQVKAFLRSGMGPCQGRLCGQTVTELIAEARGVTPADVGYFHLRPPVKPVTLAELAALKR